MRSAPWLCIVLGLAIAGSSAQAGPLRCRFELARVNRHVEGQVLDFTHNHGHDNRIWSEALHELRDLYVYLPPGYDPSQSYPVAIWLHSFRDDEQMFIRDVARLFDKAILQGKLPPMIVAAPDGSIKGRPAYFSAGSFFLNSNAGNFEEYMIHDVWTFLTEHFPIRPEREAHVLIGASMGGFGAYNLAFKYRDCFKVVAGIFPPLNLRWVDCHDRYRRNFDPCCWGWRTQLRPCEVVARFFCVIPVRLKRLTDNLYGRGPEAIDRISEENPIEMLDTYNVQPGQFDMYIGYGGKDQFNIDAQVESFLYVAEQRGLCIQVGYVPNGKHDLPTGLKLFPGLVNWLGPLLWPYAPPLICE